MPVSIAQRDVGSAVTRAFREINEKEVLSRSALDHQGSTAVVLLLDNVGAGINAMRCDLVQLKLAL